MSLVRLLTTGKSLVGMQDNLSRYRLTKKRLLPKFGSDKNPFAPPPKAEPAKPAPAEAPPAAEPRLSTAAKAETGALLEKQAGYPAAPTNAKSVEGGPAVASPCPPKSVEPILVQPAKTGTKADGAAAVVPTREPVLANRNGQRDVASPLAARSRKSVLAGNWLKVAGLLTGFLERKGRTATQKPARAPVQSELLLEKVKVVCNDLSDTDLEFRTARKPVAPANAALAEAYSPAGVPPYPPFTRPALNSARPEPTAWGRLASRFFKARQTQPH
ncbi:MAG TPA: hypothetical protein VH598_13290 [Verrucomicrobiae bacterium]|nr:hypothetical protein [Verrucomicrobiae bacterium]